jgi:hypothetical protein
MQKDNKEIDDAKRLLADMIIRHCFNIHII